jgi:hypothetical protein
METQSEKEGQHWIAYYRIKKRVPIIGDVDADLPEPELNEKSGIKYEDSVAVSAIG